MKLSRHLATLWGLKKGDCLLEIGCGRGEFLAGFKRAGLDVAGTDMCASAKDFSPELPIAICTLGETPLPFTDEYFDVVFSKSLLEHILDPAIFMHEALRVLKPGGLLVTMTPDWESCYKIFYDDMTHVRPYTIRSLRFLYDQYALKDYTVEKFIQLPVVWNHPWLKYVCRLIAPFVPVRTQAKFPRWSRELMLLAAGKK
jgi:ubiquinone/menaquinone biosynthesis C-methylase UbiE